MKKKKLKNRIVEVYQIVSELCGAGLAGLNGTNPVEEINDLMKPMEKIWSCALYKQSCQHDKLEVLFAKIKETD